MPKQEHEYTAQFVPEDGSIVQEMNNFAEQGWRVISVHKGAMAGSWQLILEREFNAE
jgi:hypothetical protein